jgi:starch-binding outer membrane protein, SusD/RagB family
MKKSIVSICLLWFLVYLLLGLLACNKEKLDVVPQDKFSDASFWKTEQQATDALTGVYTTLLEKGTLWNAYYTTYMWASGTMTDDAMGTFSAFQTNAVSTADETVRTLWAYLYTNIRTCNVFLSNIDKPVMDEAKRKRYKAEARFLRAYYYSILCNNWGGVPLVKVPLTLAELKQPRSPKAEVVKFIVDELTAAAADLPGVTGTENGRATTGAALALKARVLLYNGEYAAAATAAKSVMDLNQYQLFQDAEGRGYNSVHRKRNEGNSEVIFSIRYRLPDQFYYFLSRIQPPAYTGEGGGLQILQSFVDAFECTDGKLINVSPLFNAADEYKNRDPRLAMAIVKQGDLLFGDPIKPVAVANNYTGYYDRKLMEDTFTDWGQGETDPILIRYAEVLLIYAEAKIESNTIDQTVLDALNSIRARAYNKTMTDISAYPAVTTRDQAQLRQVLRRERRVELGCEHNDSRLSDIRRWKLGGIVLTGVAQGAKDATGATTAYRKMFDLSFDPKLYLWPIPQSEIDLIGPGLLEQNPGYQ